MSSISILATRYRPFVYRFLCASRTVVFAAPVTRYVPIKCAQSMHIGDHSLVASRCMATISRPRVSESRKPSDSGPADFNERVWNRLKPFPSAMCFTTFDQLKAAIDAKITVSNAVPAMMACSRLMDRSVDERVELIMRIWQFLVKSNDADLPLPYHSLIESIGASGKIIGDPLAFLTEIGAPQTAKTCGELIVMLCESRGSTEAATALLEHMKANGLAATERVYCAVIVGVAAQTKSMSSCDDVLTKMDKEQVAKTLETSVALVKANIECGNSETAIEMLKQNTDWNSQQLYSIIRFAALRLTDHSVVKTALELLPMPILNAKFIASELQNICAELVCAGNASRYYDPFELIIQHLPQPVFVDESTDEYGWFLIKDMVHLNVPLSRQIQFCEQLITSGRNTRAIHQLCSVALRRNLPNVPELFRHLATKEPLRPHYFWPLFAAAESEEQIFRTINLAKETKVEFDADTIEKHILARIPHTADDSMMALKTLEEMGIKMQSLRTAMISFLLWQYRPFEALNIAKSFTGRIEAAHVKDSIASAINNNIHSFKANATTIAQLIRAIASKATNSQYDLAGNILLDVAVKSYDSRRRYTTTRDLIEHLTAAKVRISAASADALLNRLAKQRDVYALCLEKIRAMIDNEKFPAPSTDGGQSANVQTLDSLQDMENHLIELESNQLNTRGILRKLYLACIKQKKFDRALELHEKCIKEKIDMSPAMMASTLILMTNVSKERAAMKALDTLQTKWPTFSIDLYKIIDLAKLLVQKNRLEDADKILRRFAGRTSAENVNYVRKNLWDFLQSIVDYSVRNKCAANMAQIMLDKLVDMGYAEYTKINFGPVIREYVAKGQIDMAVNEFERIATEHRTTPQLVTLLTMLIDLINSGDDDERWKLFEMDRPLANERLRRIVDVARKVDPPEVANTNLLTAFAISGNSQQIRKMLMNPAMQFNIEKLVDNLEHHVNTSGKIDALIKLAKCNRGLRHEAINEDTLYTMVVDRFAIQNDHEAAKEFFKTICDDDEYKISAKLKQKFDDLFMRKNPTNT